MAAASGLVSSGAARGGVAALAAAGAPFGLPLVLQVTDGDGDYVLFSTSPTGDTSVIQMARPDLSLTFRCQFGQFSVPVPPRVNEWYQKGLVLYQKTLLAAAGGAAGTAGTAGTAGATAVGATGAIPTVPLGKTDLIKTPASWRCAVCMTNTLWAEAMCGVCGAPRPVIQPLASAISPLVPVPTPLVSRQPAISPPPPTASVTPPPEKPVTATPTPRAPGVLTVKPIPGSAAAPAPAGADKKAAPASAGKVTAPLPTGPKSKAGKQSEAAANPEKQRETEKEQYSGWDGYSRTAFLHVCKNEMGCALINCNKIHGKFEPKQEARYQREVAAGKKDPSTGIAVCVFQLVGSCLRYHSGLCTYRHFTAMRELTARQFDEFQAQLAVKSKFEVAKQCCPQPVIHYPDGSTDADDGEEDDSTTSAAPSDGQSSNRVKAFGGGAGVPITSVKLKTRSGGAASSAKWSALDTAKPQSMAKVQAEQAAEADAEAAAEAAAAAPPPPVASGKKLKRRDKEHAADSKSTASSASAAPLKPQRILSKSKKGGNTAYTTAADEEAAAASAAAAAAAATVPPPANPLQAVVGALLHDATRCLHVNSLSDNLSEHGITNWNRDFAPSYGSLAEFIQSYPKVFSYDVHTHFVSLSTAAASVANASLAASNAPQQQQPVDAPTAGGGGGGGDGSDYGGGGATAYDYDDSAGGY